MYRVILQNGSIESDEYERSEHGVDLYRDDEFVAFVPYETLIAVIDEAQTSADDRSVL